METTTVTTNKKKGGPCGCLAHPIGRNHEEVEDLPNGEAEYTETDIPVYGVCGATTRRIYAPGHDAKLKGVLIRQYVADQPYIVEDGGLLIHGSPYEVARQLGWTHFLDAAKERADQAASVRQARKARKAGLPTIVKVGRWEYPIVKVLGEFEDNMIEVEYKTTKGVLKTATVSRKATR